MQDAYYFFDLSFWHNSRLLATFVGSLAIIVFLRYLLFAWSYKIFIEWLTGSSRNRFEGKQKQIFREILWSFASTIVFTGIACLGWWLYQRGLTRVYQNVREYSLSYFLVSPFLLLVLYETYYYWLHRWMHRPRVFRVVHRIHHQSLQPTVFTSFAFHPLEAFLQLIFFPLIILLIPFHYIALFIVFAVMSVSAVINHSGAEVFQTRILLKHLIGASHHDRHHTHFKYNFGLYFRWWDKLMKTEWKHSPGNGQR